jgi:flagellin
MPSVLGTNIASLWASKNLQSAQSDMANSVERLSSGLRINRARDDAAGLGIANALTKQINSSDQGIRNLNDGISIVQTAEGALAQASEIAQRMLTLAVQGQNGSMSQDGRTSIKTELATLMSAITAISTRTKFGSTTLLDVQNTTTTGTKITVYAGSDTSDAVSLDNTAFYNVGATFSVANATLSSTGTALTLLSSAPSSIVSGTALYKLSNGTITSLGTVSAGMGTTGLTLVRTGTSVLELGDVLVTSSSDNGLLAKGTAATGQSVVESVYDVDLVSSVASTAQTAFQNLATAVSEYITLVSTQRGKLGAFHNQMEYSVSNVTELSANLSAARSRVIDTDYASETAKLTKGQILQQAATAMLAQANQMPNVILSLLK